MKLTRAVGCLVGGVTLLTAGIEGWHENKMLDEYGVQAVVNPIDHYTVTTSRRDDGTVVSKTSRADLVFVTEEGKKVEVTMSVSNDTLEKFRNRERVVLEYLPENPRMTRWPGREDWSQYMIGGAVAALLMGAFWTLSAFNRI